MDAKKVNNYAHKIISLTWPKYKRHMGERDLENIKLVEDMLLQFQNEITKEFLATQAKIEPKVQTQPALDESGNKYETLTVVTFKSNFKSGIIPPFQIWKRGNEKRITDFRLRNDPTVDIEAWSEDVYFAQTILEESDKDIIAVELRKYFPDLEITYIEQIFKDKLNLVLFPSFKGIVKI